MHPATADDPQRIGGASRRPFADKWSAKTYRVVGFGLLLGLIAFSIYFPARHYGFIALDDAEYVADNARVGAGLTPASLKWAFTTGHASNWHPLTWISHLLDVQLFGQGPAAPHTINASLHAANVFLLLVLLWQLTGAVWRSTVVAALFALHPLHVESVAWISERKDVLSAFFFLLTLLAYVRYVRERTAMRSGAPDACHPETPNNSLARMARNTRMNVGYPKACHPERSEGSSTAHASGHPAGSFAPLRMTNGDDRQLREESIERVRDPNWVLHCAQNDKLRKRLGWYLAALLFFALGLMSKPMLVTLPFVLLLLDYWPLGRFAISRQDLEPSPANAASPQAVFPVLWEKLPFFVLSILSCVVTFVVQKQGGAVRSLASFSLLERVGNAFVAYARYLGKTAWPVDLAIFYPHPGHWPALVVIASVALIAGLTLALGWGARRFPFAASGWLWFLGMMIPTIGLVQVGEHSMADRYTYLPSIGLFVAAVWTAEAIARRSRAARFALVGAAGFAVVACALATSRQLRFWHDSPALFGHALAVTKNNYVAHNCLGHAWLEQGKVDEAIVEFEKTLALRPGFAEAESSLGTAWLEKGRADEAMAHFKAAIAALPEYGLAHYNLGTLLLRNDDVDGAIAELASAARFCPDDVLTRVNLGNAYLQKARLDDAISQYRRALELDAAAVDAQSNLGNALLQKGQEDEAVVHFDAVLKLEPKHANAHYFLGGISLRHGRWPAAIDHYRQALASQPDDVDTLRSLAAALAETGRFPEAIETAQHALQLATQQPNMPLTNAILSEIERYKAHLPERSRQ